MLKINDNINSVRNLDDICENHYTGLVETIQDRINKKKAKDKISFLEFLEDNLKDILKGKPDRLLELENSYRTNHSTIEKYFVEEIFNYTYFSDKSTPKKYDAYELAKNLNFNTCPYCNRNYTVTVIDEAEKTIRPDFDHFFPKSEYPLLALSFYNLIPCCLICNRTLKGTTKMSIKQHLHPYLDGFDHVLRFNYKPSNTDSAVGFARDIDICFLESGDPKDKDKLKKCLKNAQLFKLETIYSESHGSEVADILHKHYISSGNYLKTLHAAFPKLGDMDELYRLAFGNHYQEDSFEKRPLSKLTRDIFDQLNFHLPIIP